MDNRLAQYGTIARAFGIQLGYNSSDAVLEVKDIPEGHSDDVERMLNEISHFDDTSSYIDGISCFCVASFIDNVPNPIPERARFNVLHALGIMKDDRFIHQVLMLQKNNRSWHQSGVSNDCEFFGEICTHRGINPDPDRKGRVSTRKPEQYHVMNGKGVIAREQLVTPGLEKVFRMIPEDNVISASLQPKLGIDLRSFSKMETEDKLKLISELQELI